MERLRRDGGKGREGGAYCPETTAEGEEKSEKRRREREQKSDSLTAAPNGFSGEREGVKRRRRHNEGAMTEEVIDLEREMRRERQREVEVIRPFGKDGVKGTRRRE